MPIPSPDDVLELIKARRTVPLYKQTPVPSEVVHAAIDAARWAPNHRLTQPWHFYVLGPDSIADIVELNADLTLEKRGERAAQLKRDRWSAIPGWLVVTCRNSDDPIRAREDFAACACAVQNLMLYLWSAGVATKWTTGDVTREPSFFKTLGIDPDLESLVGMIWYGYAEQIPTCNRRPVEEIMSSLP